MFDNELSELDENLFRGLNELVELDLSFNSIVLIKEKTFNGLHNLAKYI
jgi:hypothetical protein